MRPEPAITYDEKDWTTAIRRTKCLFKNFTGLGKRVKRAINKRTRRRARRDIERNEQ